MCCSHVFGALLGRKHIHAGLSVQRTDGCRKIHTDFVSLRLLCTYAGPGTDWLPNEDLVREHLGRTDVDVDAGRVEVDLTVTNDKGETRVFGTAKVALPAG